MRQFRAATSLRWWWWGGGGSSRGQWVASELTGVRGIWTHERSENPQIQSSTYRLSTLPVNAHAETTHSFVYLLIHSFTYLFNHTLNHSTAHSSILFTKPLTHPLTPLTHSLTHSSTHSLTHSPTHPLTHSPTPLHPTPPIRPPHASSSPQSVPVLRLTHL